jgi:uncharacterized protein YbjT (DUF2867 family)
MMMELLQTRIEQESMHHDLTAALAEIRDLPSAIARKGEGAAAMWGPDGGDLFEQVVQGQGLQGRERSVLIAQARRCVRLVRSAPNAQSRRIERSASSASHVMITVASTAWENGGRRQAWSRRCACL